MCRHCHDEAEDHRLEASAVTAMICMHCGVEQSPAGETPIADSDPGILQTFAGLKPALWLHSQTCSVNHFGNGSRGGHR